MSLVPPKRPQTAYFIFSASVREAVKAENPGISVGGLAKIIGEKWNSLEEERRSVYLELAQEQKTEYIAAVEAYEQARRDAGASADDTADIEEENVDALQTAIPLTRMKKLLQLDSTHRTIGKDALYVIGAASELFIQLLSHEAAELASESGKKTISSVEISRAISRIESFSFMTAEFPVSKAIQQESRKKKSDADEIEDIAEEEEEALEEMLEEIVPPTKSKPILDYFEKARELAELARADPDREIKGRWVSDDILEPEVEKGVESTIEDIPEADIIEEIAPIVSEPPKKPKSYGLERFAIKFSSAEEKQTFWEQEFAKAESKNPLPVGPLSSEFDIDDIRRSHGKKVSKSGKTRSKKSKKLIAESEMNSAELENANSVILDLVDDLAGNGTELSIDEDTGGSKPVSSAMNADDAEMDFDNDETVANVDASEAMAGKRKKKATLSKKRKSKSKDEVIDESEIVPNESRSESAIEELNKEKKAPRKKAEPKEVVPKAQQLAFMRMLQRSSAGVVSETNDQQTIAEVLEDVDSSQAVVPTLLNERKKGDENDQHISDFDSEDEEEEEADAKLWSKQRDFNIFDGDMDY